MIVEREGAIRIRSDVERKRLFKTSLKGLADTHNENEKYSPAASEATYQKLHKVTKCILQSDFNAIVDATFLRRADRQRFHSLAMSQGAKFRIFDFQADIETLKQRITQRQLSNSDASDATLEVLSSQLQSQEPLSAEELELTVSEAPAMLQTSLANARSATGQQKSNPNSRDSLH